MSKRGASTSAEPIERTLSDLIHRNGTVTFSALAAMCPQYRWVSLFTALHHLEQQRVIDMTPLPWDYEISARRQTAAAEPPSDL